MKNNGLFNISNKLKSYSVQIDKYDLLDEMIISIDINYQINTPKITGILIINDIFNLNDVVTWADTLIKIQYMDLFDNLTSKIFKVININEYRFNINGKGLLINLQDTFSYGLEKSFLSKGYNDTPGNALDDYIKELKLNTDYTLDFSKIEDKKSFIVPKSKNNLDFFTSEFFKYGYNFYQSKDKVNLKSQKDQELSKLYEHTDTFVDVTDNQLYMNRIIEYRVLGTNRDQIQPKTRSFAFDHNSKSMIFYNNNSNSKFVLNDDETNLQDTQGYRDIYQQHLNFDQHDRTLKESLLKQGQIEMIVNGYNKNDLNQIYNLSIKGSSASKESYNKGNTIINGKYLSTQITDKIMGNSFIQKIKLERADAQKKV